MVVWRIQRAAIYSGDGPAWIAEVLYVGIGEGLLEPVPAARVDDTGDEVTKPSPTATTPPHVAEQGQGLQRRVAPVADGCAMCFALPPRGWAEA